MSKKASVRAVETAVQVPKAKRHLRLVKEKDLPGENARYRIANPDQLAVVGAIYLEDFRKGVRSFAVASTNYKSSQQRTVLALASFFDHRFEARILIISDSLHRGVFKELVDASYSVADLLPNHGLKRFHHHFDFLDLTTVMRTDFGPSMEVILNEYDIILWDTPLLSDEHQAAQTFTQIAGYFHSLSLVVSPAASNSRDPQELKEHFEGFGINVTGVQFRTLAGGGE